MTLPQHKDVFPDDILSRIRDLEGFANDRMVTSDIDIEGGTILSYDATTGIANVQLDDGEIVDVQILNPGGDITFGLYEGIVLVDRSDGLSYRVTVTNGMLGTEVVT